MSNKHSKGYYVISNNTEIDKPFHWVLKAPNHKVVLTASSNHAKLSDAMKEIELVRENCKVESNYERRTSENELPYFVFKVNGDILGNSEMYEGGDEMREIGIKSCIRNGTTDSILDTDNNVISTAENPVTNTEPSRDEGNNTYA